MNRTIVLLVYISILLLSCVGISFQFIEPVGAPTTWTVDDDGPADFSSIQGAINGASNGDTIFVRAGTYYENVIVNRTVSLVGEDSSNTVIDGSDAGTVVEITVGNVKISAFTIRRPGGQPNSCIRLSKSSNNTISGNKVRDSGWFGIELFSSSNNTISGNEVTTNNYVGIRLFGSSNNIILGNKVTNTDYDGIHLYGFSDNNTVENNEVVSNGWTGIRLAESSNNMVCANNITKNLNYAIRLFGSSNNHLYKNNITENRFGITLDVSPNNNIYLNNITESLYYGIALLYSSNVSVFLNDITANGRDGIQLVGSSNNTISGNIIEANNPGFKISPGARESNDNAIYHNNFIDNPQQTQIDVPESNSWDDEYPSGGNYWSDYVGADNYSGQDQDIMGGDGIGDIPYIINANNQDNYPLMERWSPQLELIVTSSPITGITFTINGTPQTTLYTDMLPEGTYVLEMPETWDGYVWSHWLQDGDANRTKTIILEADPTWTGVYVSAAPPVGGIWTPINKLELLAPYISLASLIAMAIISIVYVKYRKKKQN